ncbi:MAG: outer membrane protein OmpA-like peptidoglycan-associated protein, partial [Myxococcota bacterium]
KQVSAAFKTVRIKTLVKPAEVRRVAVNEEFKFLDKKVKTSEARIEWQPVLCKTNADRGTVRALQRALRAAGTYEGYANGTLDRKTMKGLRAYQAKNNLPQGQLTMSTLQALGVNIMCDAAVTPARKDTDGDGIYDDEDKCVNEKGPARNSGCPDGDRDSDGIADAVDNCPDEKGLAKFQGCNEAQLVKMEGDKLIILEKVHFDFNKATIQDRSFPLLNNVAKVLKNHPNIRVRVEGHTDSVGPAGYNKKLSQSRASAVRSYLSKKGSIKIKRMSPKGFGEQTPIASNDTDEGRAQNRRVEFTIISQ